MTESGLLCPKCNGATTVYNTRSTEYGTTKRWRKCLHCEYHFTTKEIVPEKYKQRSDTE